MRRRAAVGNWRPASTDAPSASGRYHDSRHLTPHQSTPSMQRIARTFRATRVSSIVLASLFAALLRAGSQAPASVVRRDTAMVNRSTNPLLSSFRFRSIGPASMGGRIDDIEVAASDPNVIYVGYAVGGVFRSLNNATTFEPVFESYGSASIGDIAIHPTNADIVYVGTGEPNNRQTSSFGDGIYKTTDAGKTCTNVGP